MVAKVRALLEQSAKAQQVLAEKDFKITALTLELAYYRRIKFGKQSDAFSGEQRELFEETVSTDLAAIKAELVPPDSGDDAAGKRKRSRAGRQPAYPGLTASCGSSICVHALCHAHLLADSAIECFSTAKALRLPCSVSMPCRPSADVQSPTPTTAVKKDNPVHSRSRPFSANPFAPPSPRPQQ